ncbi:MAG TPA: winged helix-turn-helix domain-containing protein [Solirubrobacterales bacterium]|nr:winged helix-turn-helix domain-containing protein [Solirubrobacterales bacterium]
MQQRSRVVANAEILSDELQVLVDGRRVGFTVREFQLCLLLVERLDRVVRRDDIYDLIWGGSKPPRDRSVDVLVCRVRTKLEDAAPDWHYIHTHFGIGYRFAPERMR